MAPTDDLAAESLYHVVYSTSHLSKDPTSKIERLRIPGSYTSLAAAKAAAHKTLFDAGLEREYFAKYETEHGGFEGDDSSNPQAISGLMILAVAPDGTTFRVRICTTPNHDHLTTDNEDGRLAVDLYHVIQSKITYDDGQSAGSHELDIEGSFKTYGEARNLASSVLLSEEDGITRQSFAQYDEAGPDENDCGYGENVIVHAVGEYGENYLVSVIKGQPLESVRLAEAALRIV